MRFLIDPVKFFLGVSAIAWGIGFIRYFDRWVYFPAFPNILDSIGMSLIGVYLLAQALRERGRMVSRENREPVS